MPTPVNLNSFVTYNPVALPKETRLADAIQTLAQTGIHYWPVINDDRQLVGLLSERDIIHALRQGTPQLVSAGDAGSADVFDLPVEECLSPLVESVALDERPRHVLRKMLDHDLTWLPVLQDDAVIGVTTVSDFLREFSYGQIGLSKTQVADVMEPVESIAGEASLDEVWAALQEQANGCIGVVRGEFPLGVLSETDLQLAMCRIAVSRWEDESEYRSQDGGFVCVGPRTVLELVSAAPTIRPGERLQNAATLMLDHSRQAIAVVNQANRMMGAVTERGILRRMLNYLI